MVASRLWQLTCVLGLSLTACDGAVDDAEHERQSPSIDGGEDAAQSPAPAAEARMDASARAPRDAAPALEGDAGRVESTPPTDAATPRDAALEPDASSLEPRCGELTWLNYGGEFMSTWCVSCHRGMMPVLDTQQAVQDYLPLIRYEVVETKMMPAGGGALYLRDEQRVTFGSWLDCGAP